MKISKRYLDRAKPALRRYQKILEAARTRDVNESDTVVVVSDFLQDVLGYDKYQDVTTEFAVRSTFCDLAIRIDGALRFLIEVKSVGTSLRDNHLRQAVDYAANQGVEWVLLTNGVCWKAHRMRFEQPIQNDLVFELDLLSPDAKPVELLEKLYLISRESAASDEIEQFYRRKEATNRFIVAHILLDTDVVRVVRRELRARFPGVRITEEEVAETLRSEVIKRDLLECDRATAADRAVRRAARRRTAKPATEGVAAPACSISESDPTPAIDPGPGDRQF